jgi:hypothetical protein
MCIPLGTYKKAIRTGGPAVADRAIVELALVIKGAAGDIASSHGNAITAPIEPRSIVRREIGLLMSSPFLKSLSTLFCSFYSSPKLEPSPYLLRNGSLSQIAITSSENRNSLSRNRLVI